ncbi:MAG: dihydroorotate dehydrogenase-like protein [Ardenticatenia bacterium]|nr:MAG: dihydroorotate dehydrogenase-like protein [Ardenticatenia bacterium]
MPDLTTTYLGMKLAHPIVPSASPLSRSLDGIKRMAEAGASAIVMYSLFEEQITLESQHLDHYLVYGSESYAEALSYFPDIHDYNVGPDEYLELIRRAKEAVDIPIIGSLNGVSTGGWIEYARYIQQAGADAIELNLYYIPTNPDLTSAEVEQMYLDVVEHVRQNVRIPIAVKVGPYFSAFANMAKRFAKAGANGLVLFNRFYQPDFNLETLDVEPRLVLSSPHEVRLPLHWTAILYGRVNVDLAITSGVHTHEEVLKGVMAGANVTMMASALLKNGVEYLGTVLENVRRWMEEHEYESIEQMRGSMSQMNIAEPAAFERANYMKVLDSWRDDPTGMLL